MVVLLAVADSRSFKADRKAAKVKGPAQSGATPCNSTQPADFGYASCDLFCKPAKATNHCRFCKCRGCHGRDDAASLEPFCRCAVRCVYQP